MRLDHDVAHGVEEMKAPWISLGAGTLDASLASCGPSLDRLHCPHILAPIKLDPAYAGTLAAALRIARTKGAKVTALHVAPPLADRSPYHWLDAIDAMHEALSPAVRSADIDNVRRALADGRRRTQEFIERYIPEKERSVAPLRIECRVGDPAEQIARYADEAGVDLVVLTSEPRSWWASLLSPSIVPRFLKEARKPILVLRTGDQSGGQPGGQSGEDADAYALANLERQSAPA